MSYTTFGTYIMNDILTEAADGHSNTCFLFFPRTLACLKVPIND